MQKPPASSATSLAAEEEAAGAIAGLCCVHHGAHPCHASAPEPQRDLPVPVVLQEIVLRILQAAAVEQGEAPSPQPWAGCVQAELCVPASGHPWGAEGPTGS